MQDDVKTPFAEQMSKLDKKHAGATEAGSTPVEIRSGDNEVDDALHAWIHDRLGRQLGKYAPMIERVQVRFSDENGSKGGIDKCCLIHLTLSKLPPVVVESRGASEREAFDLAAQRVERATRRDVEKHGFHTHRNKHHEMPKLEAASGLTEPSEGLLDGEGTQAGEQSADSQDGATHTAVRNFKHRTNGMPYELEDSATGKPSRKSTRGGTTGIKHANPLTLRAKAAVRSPKQKAIRAAAHRGS
jgi:putative sigma-54 modulation protein